MHALFSFLSRKAYNLRVSSIIQSEAAGSGHPTTCLSAADIMAVLFFDVMQFDINAFDAPNNDRFILSKGHASALLYAVWKELGKLTENDLLTYRQFDSVLEGHPTFRFAYTEAATGSLGIGLSIGLGQALAARLAKLSYKTYVLLGDGEVAEGSVWEAVQLAAHYKTDNLIAIIDMNELGQSDQTMEDGNVVQMEKRFSGFGWHTLVVNGNEIPELLEAFKKIKSLQGAPIVIIAHTKKGYGLPSIQGKLGFHGKAFVGQQARVFLQELAQTFPVDASAKDQPYTPPVPMLQKEYKEHVSGFSQPVLYKKEECISTRRAYGNALAVLGGMDAKVVCLDADVKNSTYAEIFESKHADRFFQCFIAEQNMVSMAVGFNRRGYVPFVSTFASFFSRAHDQIRMAAIGQAQLCLVGSHAGVSIGQDGPSQMALEDIAMMRCLPNSVVLYPCDGVSTHALVKLMHEYKEGISYLRTTRADTAILYDYSHQFKIGGCSVLRKSDQDSICIVAAGITVFEALKAHDMLLSQEIFVSVIDLYSIKPFDVKRILATVHASGNKIITVEDHYKEGGIGESIAAALVNSGISIYMLAVPGLARSGTPQELLSWAQIDAQAIVNKVLTVL